MPPNKYLTVRRILKYSSPLIRPFDQAGVRKYAGLEPRHDPIFIIGLPRSGSTYIYQLITEAFDVLYIDNLMTLGRESLCFSSWLSHAIFRDRPHGSFVSSYGNTWETGLHSPSEAGALWYRWIPENLIVVDKENMDERAQLAMKNNLRAIMNRYNKPLVVKNLYFSNRLALTHSMFPGARYIYVKRDPLYVAQSIYLSRLNNTKDPVNHWWSVKYPGFEDSLGQPLERQVALQVCEIQKLIRKGLSEIDPGRLLEVAYEDMDRDFLSGPLREFTGVGYRKGSELSELPFRPDNKQKVDDVIFDRLQQELKRCSQSNQR